MFRQIPLYLAAVGLLVCTAMGTYKHPYHMSVTTVTYDKTTKKAEVRIRFMYHDLEPAVNKAAQTEIDIKNHANKAQRDSLIFAYTSGHFGIRTDGETMPYENKSISFRDEYIFIDLVCHTGEGKEMTLRNTMCFEMETTQTNIFHFVNTGQKLTKKTVNPSAEASFPL